MFGFQQQSEAERMMVTLLTDDSKQIITSLQLNTLASFTYHEPSMAGGTMIHDQLLGVLEKVFKRPVDVSVLTMHKSLVVFRHLLLYGAEAILRPAQSLRPFVSSIAESYNTAIIAQQATGVTGMFMRMKGGAVDEGGPSREVAQSISMLLSNPQALNFERNTKADPNSLVPVGSQRQVGFITDEARYAILQSRMEQARKVELKSNLAKSDSAFGSGYNSKDGRLVVGAAHSLDEMVKEAQRKEAAKSQKFSDERRPQDEQATSSFSEYLAPSSIAPPATGDLLSMNSNQKSSATTSSGIDLLDFSVPATAPTPAPMVHPGNTGGVDVFSINNSTPPTTTPITNAVGSQSHGMNNQLNTTLPGPGVLQNGNAISAGRATGQSQQDRFAALDALNPLDSMGARPQQTQFPISQAAQPSLGPTTNNAPSQPQFAFAQQPQSNLGTAANTSSQAQFAFAQAPPSSMGAAPATSLDSLSFTMSQPATTTPNMSSLRVSSAVDPSITHASLDNDGGEFVMGGSVGSGLEPVGSAPAAPPPPPPGGW